MARAEHIRIEIDRETMMRAGWTFLGLNKKQLVQVITYYKLHHDKDPDPK